MSSWSRDHAAYHMAVLTDLNGVFEGRSRGKGHDRSAPCDRLRLTATWTVSRPTNNTTARADRRCDARLHP